MSLNIHLNTNNNTHFRENNLHAEHGNFIGRTIKIVQENPLPFILAAVLVLNLGIRAYESFMFSKIKEEAEPSRDIQKASDTLQAKNVNVQHKQESAKLKINLIFKELENNLQPPGDLPPVAPSLTQILKDNYEVYQKKMGINKDVSQEDDWNEKIDPPKDLPPVAPSISQILKDNYQNYMKNTDNPVSPHNDW